MILEGNQRAGAAKMARHLMNLEENDHVEIHEISGFLSTDIHEAFHEMEASARGTKCSQFMFSVSLNPPHKENVPIEYFEQALDDIEQRLGLENQPRIFVFHEKEGRRHAHCVWSRIDADSMTAINLPFYKQKLNDISKETYLKYDWDIPKGFLDKAYANPLNFTRQEWEQAKRAQEGPRLLKALFKNSWETSDNQAAYKNALREHGFWLARGDRRGYVAIDYKGEIYSLSRWSEVKTKELKQKLGNPKDLPSIEEVQDQIAQKMTPQIEQYIADTKSNIEKDRHPLQQAIKSLKERHRNERQALSSQQTERWTQEEKQRYERLPRGVAGFWHRITGKYQKVRRLNELETIRCERRDRNEKQTFIENQLEQRNKLQTHVQTKRENYHDRLRELRKDISLYRDMQDFSDRTQKHQQGYSQEI
ncbi:MAG: relaxase/mobilization nuclease domain-containing protein [Alphaproteobacteria bacterium]